MRIKNPALIIVDMQNDFLHPKGFVPRHAGSIGIPQASFDLLRSPTAAIKKLADHFHGAARPVVYVYTAWETDYSDVAIPLKNMRDTAPYLRERHLEDAVIVFMGAGDIDDAARRYAEKR